MRTGFLAKLLENNVPEISNGRIEIKAIARDAGNRSKAAVSSGDARIDAKGAVIGLEINVLTVLLRNLW